MKVERVIGWLKGSNGTGNIFEVSHNGRELLAMIWQDGKFHYTAPGDVAKQVKEGTASITPTPNWTNSTYLSESQVPANSDGTLSVENPSGWQRLYQPPTGGEGTGDETVETKEVIEIPFKIEGKISFDVSQFAALIKLIE